MTYKPIQVWINKRVNEDRMFFLCVWNIPLKYTLVTIKTSHESLGFFKLFTEKNIWNHYCHLLIIIFFFCKRQTLRHEDSGLCDIKDQIEEVLLAAEGLPAVSAELRELCKRSEGLTEQQSEVLRTSFKRQVITWASHRHVQYVD